jgi:hypothetical protein
MQLWERMDGELPDDSWWDMVAAKDREIFFVNVVLAATGI